MKPPMASSRVGVVLRSAWVVSVLPIMGLNLAISPAFAEPRQDNDGGRRIFSDWILGSLCQEGLPGTASGFSCTMPDGSVWTCIPANGGHGSNYECVREASVDPVGPGPVVTLPNTPPIQTR